ncbi:MAG: ribose 5-phosphate isomerase B [Mycoplasmatales bacterium]
MKIAVGSDHAGCALRKEIANHLAQKGYEVKDLGTNKDVANYAVEGIKVAENVSMGNADLGIVVCGTGIGISIAANKVKGVRCALVDTVELAKLAREHNNANILALGARVIEKESALAITDAFLETAFEAGRHLDRVDTISDYEESCTDC